MTLWRCVVLVTVAGWMFDAVWLLTGHAIDPTVLVGSIAAFFALWFLRRPDLVFRPRVHLDLSAHERRVVHARRNARPPLSWWYRLSDELHWLDEAAWPAGVAWPQGAPGSTPGTRYLPLEVFIGGLLVIACGVGLVFLGAPTWLVALIGFWLAMTLGAWAAWRMIAEAKRQGWGTNLEQ